MKSLIMIIIAGALINNVVLNQFLGICSFLGVSKQMKASISLGGAVIFVITIASAVASLLYDFVLKPLGMDFMKTIIFILVIAALGVALTNVQDGYNFIQCVASGFGTAVGYTIAIVLLAGIRSRINEKDLPAPLRGAPIVMIAAALMSIAFMGFGGLQL